MSATRAENIDALARTDAELNALAESLDNATLDARETPDDWSVREILAHLVDDEMYVMRTRMERIVKEDNPHLAPHDEKAWYASRNTTRDDMDALLADFQVQRAASLAMLRMLRESDWQRSGFQPEIGTFTAEEWLGRWVEHDTVHLEQIKRTVAKQGD